MMRVAILVASAALLSFSGAASVPGPAQPRFYVMRHLNRTADGDSLNAAGRDNACRLERWLRNRQLAAIYTSDFARAIDTARPTASSRHIVAATRGNVASLIAAARAAPQPVLVVGNSLSVQRLMGGLGGTPPPDPPFDFGKIWTIWSDGRTTLDILPSDGPGCPKG